MKALHKHIQKQLNRAMKLEAILGAANALLDGRRDNTGMCVNLIEEALHLAGRLNRELDLVNLPEVGA